MKIPLVLALVLALPVPAMAQYMYLDSNGDGVHDENDKLKPNGMATTVDIWLSTDTNRDGTPASGDPGISKEINSYAFNLLASGGTVTYQNYINEMADEGMSGQAQVVNPGDGVSYKNGFYKLFYSPPGLYRLGTLTITGTGGSPRINFVDMLTDSVPPSQDQTSFGTRSWGVAGDNTYRLDGPNTRGLYDGLPGDWSDADGLSPAGGPGVTNPGNKTVNEQALLQFTVAATDPGHTLAYSLTLGVPAATGATINPSTGVFSWTPTAVQGPGVYPVTVTATNNASTPVSGNAAFTITVNDTAPVTEVIEGDTASAGKSCAGSAAARMPIPFWIAGLLALPLVARRFCY